MSRCRLLPVLSRRGNSRGVITWTAVLTSLGAALGIHLDGKLSSDDPGSPQWPFVQPDRRSGLPSPPVGKERPPGSRPPAPRGPRRPPGTRPIRPPRAVGKPGAGRRSQPSRSVSRWWLPPGPAGAKRIARVLLGAKAVSAGQFSCLEKMWTRESNWRVRAKNPSSGAYGIPQALPATKLASAGKDWRTNPMTQVSWGLRYIRNRYDTPCEAWSFWRAHHWY